jgi:NADPH-dependent ferric siderophore reductase
LNEDEASLLPVASCIIVKSSDPEGLTDAKGKPVFRAYTPISRSDAPGELTLLIKKYENGLASKYIHGLQPGDKLAIKGPIPKYIFKGNPVLSIHAHSSCLKAV